MGGEESADNRHGKISSFCQDGSCVQVHKTTSDLVYTGSADGASAMFDREEWDAFILGVKAGEFDWDKIPQGGANGS